MKNGIKIGVVIPTCSPERAELLAFVEKRLSEQTLVPDYIAKIDYPKEGSKPDLTKRYKDGIRKCFAAGCGFVLFIEDDDYYPVSYVEEMFDWWIATGQPHIIGCNKTIYYHLFTGGYTEMKTSKHASAHGTAIAKGVNFEVCEDTNPFYDIELWRANLHNARLIYFPNHCISIKHNIGLVGGCGHKGKNYQKVDDKGKTILKGLVDTEGFEFYINFISRYEQMLKEKAEQDPTNAAFYDKVYSGVNLEYRQTIPQKSMYFPIWKKAAQRLTVSETLLELGCGVGLMAKYFFTLGLNYQRGVDFSEVAIAKAQRLNPTQANKFKVKDLTTTKNIPNDFTVLCFGVLEHLEDDLSLMNCLATGTKILFSVPDFIVVGHQRCFKTAEEVKERYSMLNCTYIEKFRIAGNNNVFLVEGRKL